MLKQTSRSFKILEPISYILFADAHNKARTIFSVLGTGKLNKEQKKIISSQSESNIKL